MTGLDVEAEVKRQLAEILEKMQKIPEGKKVYEGPEGICFARDHLYWYDKGFNSIDPPERIQGSLVLGFFKNITSLKECPEEVGGSFYCFSTRITSLEGGPKKVGGSFNCSNTNITSLEGSPIKVGGIFRCSYTNITSLEGGPKKVGESFNCLKTRITSLKGAPVEIGDIEDSEFPESISKQQLVAYKKWMKTNPTDNYPG